MNRTVSFYRLCQEEKEMSEDKGSARIKDLTEEEVNLNFDYLYNSARKITNGNRAVVTEHKGQKHVIEYITHNEEEIFLKIGRENPISTVAIRDSRTLETSKIPIKQNQLLELFTYCYIDRKTLIISYMGVSGAPKIAAIEGLFDTVLNGVDTKFASIITDDILEIISNKKIISKLMVTVALPSDEVLSNELGVSQEIFDGVRNAKKSTYTYEVTARRNKGLWNSKNQLRKLVDAIRSRHGEKLEKLNVNAKNDDEKSQSYNLLNYNFTKKVELSEKTYGNQGEVEFEKALKDVYSRSKRELQKYCR